VKQEITFMLDAMNATAEQLVDIQQRISTQRDAESLATLVSLAIEYITQLNLLLLKTSEEIEREYFKSKLILDSVDLFIGDVQQLVHVMRPPLDQVV
jgi:hypothetical protein